MQMYENCILFETPKEVQISILFQFVVSLKQDIMLHEF